MHIRLNPVENAAHGEWLRGAPGAYEWWYFDAVSSDGEWSLISIWFLGNPFSPYYRLCAQHRTADPFHHNACFFALSHRDSLIAYHFTRFPKEAVHASERLPLCLAFGPNSVTETSSCCYRLSITDENSNRRSLSASLEFSGVPCVPGPLEAAHGQGPDNHHFWAPAAPACRVAGHIAIRGLHDSTAAKIEFRGRGYHDHNWGALPFDAQIAQWTWLRLALTDRSAAILYSVSYHTGVDSRLLLFEDGVLTQYDPAALIRISGFKTNLFGTRYPDRLEAGSESFHADMHFRYRLDSAPFYIRSRCAGAVTALGQTQLGEGVGEVFRPAMLAWPVVASAMKARIREEWSS